LPANFSRSTSKEAQAPEGGKGCTAALAEPLGTSECLYDDWSPGVRTPRAEVTAWGGFKDVEAAGEISLHSWTRLRSKYALDQSPSDTAHVATFIRSFEPSAPTDDEALRSAYSEFFSETPETWIDADGERYERGPAFLALERFHYVHQCIVSVKFEAASADGQPASKLNNWMKHVTVE
jgi:hypothetical protein